METISCLIVDDEPMALALLKSYVKKTPFLELKCACETALEVLNFLKDNATVDVIFSDIQMPDLNGMELAKMLPDNTNVVFTTAFDQYAIEGYKVNAIGYLLKPFSYPEFLEVANNIYNRHQKDKNLEPKNEIKEYIFVKSEYKKIKILFKDILYIEGMKDYAKFHIKNEPKPILSLITLKKLESELPKNKFMRVHRSFIIALDKIEGIERSQVIINNQRIKIANQYKDIFDNFIKNKFL